MGRPEATRWFYCPSRTVVPPRFPLHIPGMQYTRVIVDFPDPDGNLVRLRFGRPSAIITATTVSGVRPALRAAAAASRKGGWGAGFVGYEAAPAFDAALV